MSVFVLFLVAFGLAMDSMAVSISNSINIKNFNIQYILIQSIFFGIFQFVMTLLGWFLGSSIDEYIEVFDHWIAFFMLSLIGINMIRDSYFFDKDCSASYCSIKTLILQSIATSIDALAVGVGIAVLDVNIICACFIIGIIAFLLSLLGGILGNFISRLLKINSGLLGGLILIVIGFKILIEHTLF